MKGDDGGKGKQLLSATANVVKRTRYGIVARAIHPETRFYFETEPNVLPLMRLSGAK